MDKDSDQAMATALDNLSVEIDKMDLTEGSDTSDLSVTPLSYISEHLVETDDLTEHICGHDMPFLSSRGTKENGSFLKYISRFPQLVRDKIWEEVLRDATDKKIRIVMMSVDTQNFIRSINYGKYVGLRADRRFELATIANPDGHWPYSGSGLQDWNFCYLQALVQRLHQLSLQCVEGAAACRDDFLAFTGKRLVVQLSNITHEFMRAEALESIPWLEREKLYHQFFRHFSITFAKIENIPTATNDLKILQAQHIYDRIPHFVKLCEYISKNFPALQSITLWFHLTRRQLDAAIAYPNYQAWLVACRLLKAKKVNFYINLVDRYSANMESPMHERQYPSEQFGWEDEEYMSFISAKEALFVKFISGEYYSLSEDIQEDLGLEPLFGDTEVGL